MKNIEMIMKLIENETTYDRERESSRINDRDTRIDG